ncbi:MAG: hypothetical protein ACYTG1_08850 [Planctomycetota bacterium]|jgi:hypothetical protein
MPVSHPRRPGFALAACLLAAVAAPAAARAGDDPYADAVVAYDAGIGAAAGYLDAATAVGPPERFTGELFAADAVVSPFSPPFGPDEIVSIGIGGHLVLRFDTPVTDDPANLHGVDLIVFGNTGFVDDDWPNGLAGIGLFGADGGTVEVSADGVTWHAVPGAVANGLFPTSGYTDTGPYDAVPGTSPTDFTRPVDPALVAGDFVGLDHAGVLDLYRGAGGGLGIDLADAGLAAASWVRIANPLDNAANIEVDAVSDVAPRLPGDVDLDGTVDVDDLLLLLGAWGPVVPGGPPADFDLDGDVDVADLLLVLGSWS